MTASYMQVCLCHTMDAVFTGLRPRFGSRAYSSARALPIACSQVKVYGCPLPLPLPPRPVSLFSHTQTVLGCNIEPCQAIVCGVSELHARPRRRCIRPSPPDSRPGHDSADLPLLDQLLPQYLLNWPSVARDVVRGMLRAHVLDAKRVERERKEGGGF